MNSTACSAEVAEPPLAGQTSTVSSPATKKPKRHPLSNRRTVRFRDACIELVLCPGGMLRRWVVLKSHPLRDTLGQPGRREIDPLYAKQEHFELRTSELWELGEREAARSLRLLYTCVRKLEHEQAAAPARISAKKAPGKTLKPSLHDGDAFGVLVDILPNGIDVLQKSGEVRRIVDLDITRALEASGAKKLDTIRVIRGTRHTVEIREESTGSHGEKRRTFPKGRTTYEIVREPDPEQSPAEHPDMDLPPGVHKPSHSLVRGGVR